MTASKSQLVVLTLQKLEDLGDGTPLLPSGDPKARAHSRLWSDHVCCSAPPSWSFYILNPIDDFLLTHSPI